MSGCIFGDSPSTQALTPARADQPPEMKRGTAKAERERLRAPRLTVPEVSPKHVQFYLITEEGAF